MANPLGEVTKWQELTGVLRQAQHERIFQTERAGEGKLESLVERQCEAFGRAAGLYKL